jgi:hypothetical protein
MSLSVPIQDLMLNTLLLASLDPQTQREWELFTSTRRDIPSTKELVSFVEARCKAVELLQVFQSPRTNPAPTGSSSTRPANPAAHKVGRHDSYSNVATQLQCTLCDESHRLFKCDRFLKLQPTDRIKHVKQAKLCFNCLQPFTKNHVCSNQTCRT